MKKSTKAIHAGTPHNSRYGEVSIPIYQSSTFSFPSAEDGAARFSGSQPGYIYTRMGNPTVSALEENVAALENGYKAMATATGMAAISTVFLALLAKGSHIVCGDCVYGPTRVVLETAFAKFGVESSFVDTANVENIKSALRPNTKIVFLETPANPTMKISDIAGGARIARQHGAVFVVDNTFASPFLQRPF